MSNINRRTKIKNFYAINCVTFHTNEHFRNFLKTNTHTSNQIFEIKVAITF